MVLERGTLKDTELCQKIYLRGYNIASWSMKRGGRENRSEWELRGEEEERGRNTSGQNASTLPVSGQNASMLSGSWDLSARARLHRQKSCKNFALLPCGSEEVQASCPHLKHLPRCTAWLPVGTDGGMACGSLPHQCIGNPIQIMLLSLTKPGPL